MKLFLSSLYFYQFGGKYAAEEMYGKKNIVLGMTYALELLLRFMIYTKRNDFNAISRRLVRMYYTVTEQEMKNFKWKLLVIIFVNDFVNAFVIIFLILVRRFFLFLPVNDSYCVSNFLFNFNLMTMTIPVHFCWYCFILNQIFDKMKKNLCKRNINVHPFYHIYDDICDLISFINETFQTLLLITFSVLLAWIFYDVYEILFLRNSPLLEIAGLLGYVITRFIRVSFVCWYSSSVMKFSFDVKNIIFKIPCDITPLVLHVQNRNSLFTLLDAIPIGKSLMATFIGSFFTYGMLIATFTANNTDNVNDCVK